VEGEVQGNEDAVTKFLKDVDSGPRQAKVVKLDKEDREIVAEEKSFELRT
jgi:acylphosphatase